MSVLEKAVQVLDVLGGASGPVRLGTIAESMSIPKSSAHRLLTELAELGMVRRAGDGEYALGYRLVHWGHLADRSVGLRSVAEPIMNALRDDIGESVSVYVVEDLHRVCVLVSESRHALRPVARPGIPMPLGFGAAGKVLMAHADERVRRAVADTQPCHRGRGLPTDDELADIRREGIAVSVAELEDGLTAVATPLRAAGGGVFGALSTAGASTRMPEESLPEISSRLIAAAARISAELGG